MMSVNETTMILRNAARGNRDAMSRLMSHVYEDLRAMAGSYLKHQSAGHTLAPTALINEAYLKLVQTDRCDWRDRAHFLTVASAPIRQACGR